jgi:type II secretory pathway component GspD/PulD (secretin)
MKKIILSLLVAGLAGLAISARAQNPPDQPNPPADQPGSPPGGDNGPDAGGPPPPPPEVLAAAAAAAETGTNDNHAREPLVITPSRSKAVPQEEIVSDFMPPAQAGTNVNDLNLNFNRAPLEMVLNYLSDAAGFIIVQDTRVTGTVTVSGKHLTQDEAVNLLNAVLNKNGYAVIRDGRTLTVVDKNDAKTRDIPVKSGNRPEDIPKNAEIVTQIIPIRFVEARQLMSDMSLFVSPQATVVANEAGNSIVITDTQSNIRHLAEIIRAIDNSAEAETEIRVFPLKYANPSDVASELGSIFPSSTSGSGSQSPIRFGGGGGGPGGFFQRMMAANAGGAASGSNDRIKKATQVTAVADARIQAVIVTAPKDLIEQIASMMKELDVPSTRDQDVYVFKLNNGDPQQAATVLQNMFQSTSSRNSSSSSSQNSALMQRAQNNATTSGSSSSSSSSSFGTPGGAAGGGRTTGF